MVRLRAAFFVPYSMLKHAVIKQSTLISGGRMCDVSAEEE